MYIISLQANLAQSSSLESSLYNCLFSFINDVTGSLYLFSAIAVQVMLDKERKHWIATHYQNVKGVIFSRGRSLVPI